MIKKGKKLLNPLGTPIHPLMIVSDGGAHPGIVAAQNFEYKMSNILDKPLESSFG
jgi:hypothetical protein